VQRLTVALLGVQQLNHRRARLAAHLFLVPASRKDFLVQLVQQSRPEQPETPEKLRLKQHHDLVLS
jgi:hypothetical protein